jgi:hypothetical protein
MKSNLVHEQLKNIRESISNSRVSKVPAAPPSGQAHVSRAQHQQNAIGSTIEECASCFYHTEMISLTNLISSQTFQRKIESSGAMDHSSNAFASAVHKNQNSLACNRSNVEFCRDTTCLSQATTTIMDAGGDDSFRKMHRGSQGSGGNFSQDKLSFSGSDTIDIMGK